MLQFLCGIDNETNEVFRGGVSAIFKIRGQNCSKSEKEMKNEMNGNEAVEDEEEDAEIRKKKAREPLALEEILVKKRVMAEAESKVDYFTSIFFFCLSNSKTELCILPRFLDFGSILGPSSRVQVHSCSILRLTLQIEERDGRYTSANKRSAT